MVKCCFKCLVMRSMESFSPSSLVSSLTWEFSFPSVRHWHEVLQIVPAYYSRALLVANPAALVYSTLLFKIIIVLPTNENPTHMIYGFRCSWLFEYILLLWAIWDKIYLSILVGRRSIIYFSVNNFKYLVRFRYPLKYE